MRTQQEKARMLINQGNELRENKKLPEAIAVYERAIALIPAYQSLKLVVGDMYFELGQYAEAAQAYRETLDTPTSHTSEHDQAWGSLGQCLLLLSQPDEAIPVFEKAVALHPRDVLSWYYYGVALSQTGDKKKALTALHKALKLRPDWLDRASQEAAFSEFFVDGKLAKTRQWWQFWRR